MSQPPTDQLSLSFDQLKQSDFDELPYNSHVVAPSIKALGLAQIGIDSLLDALDKGETARKEGRQPISPVKAYDQLYHFNTTQKLIEEKQDKLRKAKK